MASESNSQAFLERLCDELVAHKRPLLVVLPGRRAQFILHRLLEERGVKQEQIVLRTADQLMEELSDLELIEPQEALVVFYKAYCSQEAKPQPFEEFSKWASVFLADINDVDLHLSNIDSLYKQIAEYKSIEIEDAEVGPLEQSFRGFWASIPSYYKALNKALKQVKLGYRGLIYRTVAEKCTSNVAFLEAYFKNKTTYWVGVVPGNPSEKQLLDWIEENSELKIVIDVDEYYISREYHEAGRLFRKDVRLKNANWKSDLLGTSTKQVKCYPTSGNAAQVINARFILQALELSEQKDTVIVIADSNLLLPTIGILGNEFDLNFTLGLNLSETSIHRFVMSWIDLHANALVSKDEVKFDNKRLQDFLTQSYVDSWLEGRAVWSSIEKTIVKRNWKYVPRSWLKTELAKDMFGERAFHTLFDWTLKFDFVFDRVSKTLEEWQRGRSVPMGDVDKTALPYYIKKWNRLFSQFSEVLENSEFKVLRSFIHRQMVGTKFRLEGGNDATIQVMNLFETRLVDFKNVIVLGASEDNLPGTGSQTSLIPVVHRLHHKLPTNKDSQALAAYHFYRLIQRAEDVHLFYSTSSDGLSGGEASRYLLQLELELALDSPNFSIEHVSESMQIEANAQKRLSIQKSEPVIHALRSVLEAKLSPSAINTFINSPLEFYFYYVIRIREQEKVEEDMEASTFGSVVHDVLQSLYEPYRGSLINFEHLEDSLSRVDQLVQQRFLQDFDEADLERGKNKIQFELAKDFVRAFVNYDLNEMREHGPVKILALEDRLEDVVVVNGLRVRMMGFADRIDERAGVVRIIDYKTGKVDAKDLKCDFHAMFSDLTYAKALQLAFYKWAYAKRHSMPTDQIESVIYSFRRMNSGYMHLNIQSSEEFISGFEEGMGQVVNEMLDETRPFEHRDTSMYTTI